MRGQGRRPHTCKHTVLAANCCLLLYALLLAAQLCVNCQWLTSAGCMLLRLTNTQCFAPSILIILANKNRATC